MLEDFDTLEELKELVESLGGLLTVDMEDVRDAYGAGRLGVHVRQNISKALNGLGLGHYPAELPDRQWELIRVYKFGTPAADLIGAVRDPSVENDELIREAVGGNAAETLEQIRELVC
jgi:hypothetical protein